MDFINDFKNIFLDIYIFLPIIFAILLGISTFIKNPNHIRRITKAFFIGQFALATCMFFGIEETSFSIFNFNFLFDSISSILIFITSLIFLLFSVISKTFIKKIYRLFFSSFSLLFGLINILILSDNIFITLLCVFWIFIVYYLLNNNFSIEDKRHNVYQIISDLSILIFGIMLITYNFARFFIINNIPFNFTNIGDNLYHINNFSATLAFIGFFIIIFRFLNLIPFNGKIISNSKKINPFIITITTISSVIIGTFLFIKLYYIFDYLIYENEGIIALFLIFNFIYFVILSTRSDSLIKFSMCLLPVFISGSLFSIFSFEEKGLLSFIYSNVAIIISFSLLLLLFSLLIELNKTDDISELKKISKNNKVLKFFTIFSLLNIARVPFLALFSSTLISLIAIFSTDYECDIINISQYLLVFGTLLVSIYSINMFYKILIEPIENPTAIIKLKKHQIFTLGILVFLTVIIGICPQYFFNGSF